MADDTVLAKTRHTIGTILKQQNDEYEQAMKEFVENGSDDESSKELLQQKKLKMFQFPEDIPEIAGLFSRISLSNEPRKFRKTSSNVQGFAKNVNNVAEFEKLERYDGFTYVGGKKKTEKVWSCLMP